MRDDLIIRREHPDDADPTLALHDAAFGIPQGRRESLERELDVYVIHVLSQEEMDPELQGDLRLIDSEDDDEAEITVSSPLLDRYRRTLAAFVDGARQFCTRRGMSYVLASNARPVDRESYELYLRGMHQINTVTQDGYRNGIAFLHQAVDRDQHEGQYGERPERAEGEGQADVQAGHPHVHRVAREAIWAGGDERLGPLDPGGPQRGGRGRGAVGGGEELRHDAVRELGVTVAGG